MRNDKGVFYSSYQNHLQKCQYHYAVFNMIIFLLSLAISYITQIDFKTQGNGYHTYLSLKQVPPYNI